MYQFSLAWFVDLYNAALSAAHRPGPAVPPEHDWPRLREINSSFTLKLYRTVARSIYERDRPLFSALMLFRLIQSEDALALPLFSFITDK